jgi:hypothetical protein
LGSPAALSAVPQPETAILNQRAKQASDPI